MWFKVDDSFYDHPKVFDAPDSAVALWIRAGSWSARNLTDGFVPANLPARLCDDPDTAIRQLIDRGLWRRTKGGYLFHEWAHYQPTADETRELKRKRTEAGKKGGQAKANKQTASKCQASANGVAKQNPAPYPYPIPYPDGSTDPSLIDHSPRGGSDPAFDRFWREYPRHVAKRKAEQAWRSARKRTDPETIIDGARRYAAARRSQDASFTKHPTTWLNGDCWDDDEPLPSTNGHQPYRNPDPSEYDQPLLGGGQWQTSQTR